MTAPGVTALIYFTETRVFVSGASDDTFDGPSDFPPETGPKHPRFVREFYF